MLQLLPASWKARGSEERLPALTLAEARRLALERDGPLLAAQEDFELAEAHPICARAFPNPRRSASVQKLQAGVRPIRSASSRDTTAAVSGMVRTGAGARAGRETVRMEGLSAASRTRSAKIAEDRSKAGEASDAERERVVIAAGRFETDVFEAGAVPAPVALQAPLGAPRPDSAVRLAADLAAARREVLP